MRTKKKYKKFFCEGCNKVLGRKDMSYSKTEWKIHPLTKDNVKFDQHKIVLDEAKGGKWRITMTTPALKESMLNLLPLKVPRRTLQHRFDTLCMKVLKKKMSFHILRHGFGNHLVNDLKMPLPMVQGFMGHSSINMTGEYAKANPEQAIKETWEKMI